MRCDSGDELECVDKFCYLEDMIESGGGAEEAAFSPQINKTKQQKLQHNNEHILWMHRISGLR